MISKKLHISWSAIFVLIYSLLLIFSVFDYAKAAGSSFITTWKTDNEGTSLSNQISIPVNSGAVYDYYVDWGDGTHNSNVAGEITHTYPAPGTYTVSISGIFPRIQFSDGGDRKKILSVEQWGDIVWTSAESAFSGATNLVINAVDRPNLSAVKNVSYMFKNAKSVENGFDNWDVSSVEIFSYMFSGASKFNSNISAWNMSNAFNVEGMFQNATTFNQDIGSWQMSKVGNVKSMFSGAVSFNKSLDMWDTSRVFNVEDIFRNASSFDKTFGRWNIGSIQYIQNILSGASLSTQQYDLLLSSWRQSQTVRDIVIDAGNSSYCTSSESRDYLVGTLGWTINDAGADTVFCGAVDVNFAVVPLLDENQPADTLVGQLVVDSSLGGNFSLSLNCSPSSYDSQFFELRNNQIFTTNIFDYENPQDDNLDNAYELCILVSNENGESTKKFVLVTVYDIEDDVQISNPGQNNSANSGGQVSENGQTLGTSDNKDAGKVLALVATGLASSMIGVYIGLLLSGVTTLGFRKKNIVKVDETDIFYGP